MTATISSRLSDLHKEYTDPYGTEDLTKEGGGGQWPVDGKTSNGRLALPLKVPRKLMNGIRTTYRALPAHSVPV